MNKYCNLDGTKKIREDFPNINTGFDKVETDMVKAQTDINSLRNLTYTGSEHDALVTSALVDAESEDFGPEGTQTYLDGRLEKWENRQNTHKADNAAHGDHRNILHNWDFRNPVNQRGLTAYTVDNTYTIDRWRKTVNQTGASDVTINNGGISFNLLIDNAISTLHQAVEDMNGVYASSVLTASAEIDGVIYTKTVDMNTFSTSSYFNYETGASGNIGKVFFFGKDIINKTITFGVSLRSIPSTSINITRVKLEIGDTSTLANDPPADYGEQLALCQRYCVVFKNVSNEFIGQQNAYSETNVYPLISLPSFMRAVPTVTLDGTVRLRNGATDFNVSSLVSKSITGNQLIVQAITTGVTAGTVYGLLLVTNSTLILSADL